MISVCMATHNGGKYIKEQIDSILPQLTCEDEVIVSDDGSSDDTVKIVEGYKDARIKVLHYKQEENVPKWLKSSFYYATMNFGNALNNAKGDIIFLCDQDDVWYPDKVRKMGECLKTYFIVKHDYSIINGDGLLVKERYYNPAMETNRSLFHLLKYLPFRGCCMAFRRDVLTDSLPFPRKCYQHDSWIGMMAKVYKRDFCYLDEPLIYHRIHSNNVSELRSPNSVRYKLKYRLNLVFQILSRILFGT